MNTPEQTNIPNGNIDPIDQATHEAQVALASANPEYVETIDPFVGAKPISPEERARIEENIAKAKKDAVILAEELQGLYRNPDGTIALADQPVNAQPTGNIQPSRSFNKPGHGAPLLSVNPQSLPIREGDMQRGRLLRMESGALREVHCQHGLTLSLKVGSVVGLESKERNLFTFFEPVLVFA